MRTPGEMSFEAMHVAGRQVIVEIVSHQFYGPAAHEGTATSEESHRLRCRFAAQSPAQVCLAVGADYGGYDISGLYFGLGSGGNQLAVPVDAEDEASGRPRGGSDSGASEWRGVCHERFNEDRAAAARPGEKA